MAIKVTANLTTVDGFQVSECFGFLDIYYLNTSWTNIRYYKSEADYENGLSPLMLSPIDVEGEQKDIPSRVSLDIDANTFWGTQLTQDVHDIVKAEVESVTGVGTVSIVTLETTNQ